MARPKHEGQTSTTAIRLRPWTKGQLMRHAQHGETADKILTKILTGECKILPLNIPKPDGDTSIQSNTPQ